MGVFGMKLGNRWLVLFAGALNCFALGGVYAWSVFQKPMIAIYHWTPAQFSLDFTIGFVTMALTMMIAGRLQDKYNPRVISLVGGIMWGAGFFLSGFAHSIWQLYLYYGVIGGFGNGIFYAPSVANTIKWFPDKKGMASGIVVACVGIGSMACAPMASYLVVHYGVLAALKIVGSFYIVITLVASIFMVRPPEGYKPPNWQPSPAESVMFSDHQNKGPKAMLSDPLFYAVWLMYALGAASGLMILSQAVPISEETRSLSVAASALMISLLSFGNTLGRLGWGWVSDKLGRYQTLVMVFGISSLAMLALYFNMKSDTAFIAALFFIGLCFGANLALFPTVISDLYGPKNLGINYGILWTAFSVASYIGPRAAAMTRTITGGYTEAFGITALFGIMDVALTIFVMRQVKKRRIANDVMRASA
jgi:OFA family oxalate/formate antiporter-like MFS transporter